MSQCKYTRKCKYQFEEPADSVCIDGVTYARQCSNVLRFVEEDEGMEVHELREKIKRLQRSQIDMQGIIVAANRRNHDLQVDHGVLYSKLRLATTRHQERADSQAQKVHELERNKEPTRYRNLRARVRELKAVVKTRDEWIEKLEAEAAGRNPHTMDMKIRKRNTVIGELKQRIEMMDSHIEVLQTDVQSKDELIDTMSNDAGSFREALWAREKEIAELKTKVFSAPQLNEAIRYRNEKIERLRAEVLSLKSTLGATEAQDVRNGISACDLQRALREKASELDNVYAQLRAVEDDLQCHKSRIARAQVNLR